MKKRAGNAGLLAVALSLCVITSMLGLAMTRLGSVLVGTLEAERINAQCLCYASSLAEAMRGTAFWDINSKARAALNSSEYESKVTVDFDAATSALEKNIQIDVYYGKEDTPRSTLSLTRYKQGNRNFPVGAIIAWPKNSFPSGGGTWLPCTGEYIGPKYTKLRELLGSWLTPNMKGLFLRGYGYSNNQRNMSGALMQVQTDAAEKNDVDGSAFSNFIPQMFVNGRHWEGEYSGFNINQEGIAPTGMFKIVSVQRVRSNLAPIMYSQAHDWNYTTAYQVIYNQSNNPHNANEMRPNNIAVQFIIKAE